MRQELFLGRTEEPFWFETTGKEITVQACIPELARVSDENGVYKLKRMEDNFCVEVWGGITIPDSLREELWYEELTIPTTKIAEVKAVHGANSVVFTLDLPQGMYVELRTSRQFIAIYGIINYEE